MIFWLFFGTRAYRKGNFCFNESIFQQQIKHFSHQSEFWQVWRKPAVIFSKWQFFKILWWFHEAHNWVKCCWKNEIFFSTFHLWKIDNTFVTFVSNRSLDLETKLMSLNFSQKMNKTLRILSWVCFVHFFGRNCGLTILFRDWLTFRTYQAFSNNKNAFTNKSIPMEVPNTAR